MGVLKWSTPSPINVKSINNASKVLTLGVINGKDAIISDGHFPFLDVKNGKDAIISDGHFPFLDVKNGKDKNVGLTISVLSGLPLAQRGKPIGLQIEPYSAYTLSKDHNVGLLSMQLEKQYTELKSSSGVSGDAQSWSDS